MVIWYKFCSSTSFSYLFIYLFFYHVLFLFLYFYTFIWLQGDLRVNWTKVIFYFCLILTYFMFYQLKITIFFLSIIIHYLIHFIFLLLVRFHLFVIIRFIFFIEHIFYKIILNIYFDHIHIMCLYRIFSVLFTGYMLVVIMLIYFDNQFVKIPIVYSICQYERLLQQVRQ